MAVKRSRRAPRAMTDKDKSALQSYADSMGIEGDLETQMWHVTFSLLVCCEAVGLDFDELVSEVRSSDAWRDDRD